MKLEALAPMTVLDADGKPCEIAVGATFDVADTGEAKRMVRGGVAKAAEAAGAPSAAAPADPADPRAFAAAAAAEARLDRVLRR